MIEVELEQGSEHWLAWRAGKSYVTTAGVLMPATLDGGIRITATAGAVIGGSSPFQTADELWNEFMGYRQKPESNYAMARGSALEPLARAAYCDHIGEDYLAVCVQSEEHDWIGASLDGVDILRTRGVEIKCPLSQAEDGTHKQAMNGVVVPYYYDQIQWQMLASDNQIKEIDYFSYFPAVGQAAPITVYVDLARQAELLAKAIEFRQAITNRIPLCGAEFDSAARTMLLLKRQKEQIESQIEATKIRLEALAAGKKTSGGGISITYSAKANPELAAGVLATKAGMSNDEFIQMTQSCKEEPGTDWKKVLELLGQTKGYDQEAINAALEESKAASKVTVSIRETPEAKIILEQIRVEQEVAHGR